MKKTQDENKFTDKEEIEYPSEDDFVDVKVLNNNTRLLDEKKANISDIEASLQGIAKERSEYSIEDKVSNLSSNIENLEKVVSEISNKGVIKSVQKLSGSCSSTVTLTISEINPSKSFIIIDSFGGSIVFSESLGSYLRYIGFARAYIANATSVSVSPSILGSGNIGYRIQVIEFY